jgi:hypothetical protein
MNERIRSLIERAEYQVGKQYGPDWEVYVEPSREQIFEKFAELIVKECYLWAKENGGLGCEEDFEALKEHFGVEQ